MSDGWKSSVHIVHTGNIWGLGHVLDGMVSRVISQGSKQKDKPHWEDAAQQPGSGISGTSMGQLLTLVQWLYFFYLKYCLLSM